MEFLEVSREQFYRCLKISIASRELFLYVLSMETTLETILLSKKKNFGDDFSRAASAQKEAYPKTHSECCGILSSKHMSRKTLKLQKRLA